MGSRVMCHQWDRLARARIIRQAEVILMPGEADQLEAIWERFENEFDEDADAVVYTLYYFQQCLSHFPAWYVIDPGITVMELLSLSILIAVEETNDNNSLSFMKRIFSDCNLIRIKERRNQLRRIYFALMDWRVSPTYFQIKAFVKKLYMLLGDKGLDNADQMSEMQGGFLIDMFEYKCRAQRGRHPIWDFLLSLNQAVVKELNAVYDELNQQGLIVLCEYDDAIFETILIYAEACLSGTDKEAPYAEMFAKCVIDYVNDQFIEPLCEVYQTEKELFYAYAQSHYRTFMQAINLTNKPWLQDKNFRNFLWGLVLKQPERLHQVPAMMKVLEKSGLAKAFFADEKLSLLLRNVMDDVLRKHPTEAFGALTKRSLILYSLKFKLNNITVDTLKYSLPLQDYQNIVEYQLKLLINVIGNHLYLLTSEISALVQAMMSEGVNPGHLVYSLNCLMIYMDKMALEQVDALLNNRRMLCAFAGLATVLNRAGLRKHIAMDFIATHVLYNYYEGVYFDQSLHTRKRFCRLITLQLLARRLKVDNILLYSTTMKPKLNAMEISRKDIEKFDYQTPITFFAVKHTLATEKVKTQASTQSTSPVMYLSDT